MWPDSSSRTAKPGRFPAGTELLRKPKILPLKKQAAHVFRNRSGQSPRFDAVQSPFADHHKLAIAGEADPGGGTVLTPLSGRAGLPYTGVQGVWAVKGISMIRVEKISGPQNF